MRTSFGNGIDTFYGQMTVMPLSSLVPGIVTQANSGNGYSQFAGVLNVGFSGGDYPAVGYNWKPDGGVGTAFYVVSDLASRIKFGNGGMQFQTAPAGLAGAPITFANALGIGQAGNVVVSAPSTGVALTVSGLASNRALVVIGSPTVGSSYGVTIQAGTNISDAPLLVRNAGNTNTFFQIFGNGNVGFNGVAAGLGLVSGWGTPINGGTVANFQGSGATLSSCGIAISQIISDLKSLGLYGA